MHTVITNPTLAKISIIVLLIVISGFIIVETPVSWYYYG